MKKITVLVAAVLLGQGSAFAQVSYQRLVNAAKEPANWLTYAGDYTSQR